MTQLWNWIITNPWTALGYLYAILNMMNGLLPSRWQGDLGIVLTILNRITMLRRGTLSAPGSNGPPMGGGTGLMIMLLGLSVANVSCSWWQKKAEPAIVDCASQQLTKIESDLAGVVASALASESWQSALTGLAIELGKNGFAIVSCTVGSLLHASPGLHGYGLLRASTPPLLSPAQLQHAHAWLAEHH